MLSTATPPVSVSTVHGGSQSASSTSPGAETSARALADLPETPEPEHAADAGGGEAPAPSEGGEAPKSESLRASARDELLEVLRGGHATRQRIADELNADPAKPHVAQGPIEALLKALVDEGMGTAVMLGDPQELHYRLVEAAATPAVVLDRRTRILATLACNALSSVVPSELDDLGALEPKDLDGLTLDGVLELGATFFGFKPDRTAAAGDLEALLKSNVLVTVDDATGTAAHKGPDEDDQDLEEEEEGLDDDERDSDAAEGSAPTAPSDVRYTFAKGKLAEYLVEGAPALALRSMPDAVQASLHARPPADDRTAFERTASNLLDAERDTHARTKDKLARVYEWLKDKGIDTELLDGRLESMMPPTAKPAPAGTKFVMRRRRVPTEKADVVRLLEELNELASEESLLPQTVKDAQERARDLVKAAKDAAKRRGEELSGLRQEKVSAARQNETVVERRCRVEHDFVANTVRYIDVATDELFDVEPFAAGPLFEPKPDGAAPAHVPETQGADGGAAPAGGATPAPLGDEPTEAVANGASVDGTAPAGATPDAPAPPTPPSEPGFTRRPAPVDAADAASQAESATTGARAARVPRTGKKVAFNVRTFEAYMTTVLRAASADGVPTTDVFPRVLAEAGLTETPKGVPALFALAEKNLKTRRLVEERDGRLFWVGPSTETAVEVPAKRAGNGKRDKPASSGKSATRARGSKRR